jgi:hypothetical protein
MKILCIALTTIIWAQTSSASDSSFLDDAPKGFIHITQTRYDREVQTYLKADSVQRIEQYAEDSDGKLLYYVDIYTTGTAGSFDAPRGGNARGTIRMPQFTIEFATKEEAAKCLKRLLELCSPPMNGKAENAVSGKGGKAS